MNDLVLADRAAEWRRLKSLVLDSVSSPITRRVYNLGVDEFFAWYAIRPWLYLSETCAAIHQAGPRGMGAAWRFHFTSQVAITSTCRRSSPMRPAIGTSVPRAQGAPATRNSPIFRWSLLVSRWGSVRARAPAGTHSSQRKASDGARPVDFPRFMSAVGLRSLREKCFDGWIAVDRSNVDAILCRLPIQKAIPCVWAGWLLPANKSDGQLSHLSWRGPAAAERSVGLVFSRGGSARAVGSA